jgi:RHS repeat-associated protein
MRRITSMSRAGLVSLGLCCILLLSQTTLLPPGLAAKGARATAASPAVPPSLSHEAGATRRGQWREGELVVRFREGVSEQSKGAVAAVGGARRKKGLRGGSRLEKLELQPGHDAAAAAEVLRLHPEVELAEPNYLITRAQVAPNDARYGEQWALRNTGQSGGTPGTDIGAAAAWQMTTGAESTVVAVLDSGVDFTHQDLADNRWVNGRERDNQRDDDHNGYVNDLHGWDFVTDTGVARDPHGHGTSVAGVIAARGDNRVGAAGVMWRAGLMSLRVLDAAGVGDVAAAVEAIDYAAAMGASVINCSWGSGAESLALRDAIVRAGSRGVLVVASAGNGAEDIDGAPYYPAAFDLPNLIAVAATDRFDNLAPFSNRGAVRVAVAAPGVDILTTKTGGGYFFVNGTSAAAALVSGVAGLLKTASPWLDSAARLKGALADGARRVDTLAGKVATGGVVNAPGALRAAQASGGGGNGGQPPRPHPNAGNRGRNVKRVTPPSSNVSGAQIGPDLNELRGQPSHAPTGEPRDHIRANLPPICADCFEAGGTSDPQFSTERDEPHNETGQPGEDLGSKNFNWAMPLVSLPGRAGHDLNLTLYYNSLVWTKQGGLIQYNADGGFPAPGFHLGFPVLQKRFLDAETSAFAYMLVTPSGGRVKLVRVGATNVYEAIDGSYTRLDKATNVVTAKGGTQYVFGFAMGTGDQQERRCTQIKDRNGNIISIDYHADGRVQKVTDTLLRVVNFSYDADGNLSHLTQSREASGHTNLLARFDYGTQLIQPSFPGLTVFGPVDQYISVLTQVTFADESSYGFDWTYFGQVTRIRRQAPDGHVLSYTRYNLPGSEFVPMSPQSDCPRFTERLDYVEKGVRHENAYIYTRFQSDADNSWSLVVLPDDTPSDPNDNIVEKQYFETEGWRKGLPKRIDTFRAGSPTSLLKWTTMQWTQDDESLAYPKNPRPIETDIRDAEGNRRRTTVEYVEGFSLPTHIREWGGPNADQLLRMTATSYNLHHEYVNRRIIGLPDRTLVFDGPTGAIVAKTAYQYDLGNEFRQFRGNASQHDANYGAAFQWRGNAWSVARFDANYPNDWSRATETRTGYDTNGSPVFTYDASGHITHFDYADNYSDGNNSRLTHAYPTTVTDPEGYASTAKYNYATGAVVEARRPSSGTNAPGSSVTYETHVMLYDWVTRLQKVTNLNSDLYKRYEYTANSLELKTFSNLKPGGPESYSVELYDGAGRVRAAAGYMPERTDRYRGVLIEYDPRGLVVRQSKPTEITGGWEPTGDDAGPWRYTAQAYDWQGRPTETTRADGYTASLSYGGCGCAGGLVVTARDEAGRRRRLYNDALGRLTKVEELNWEDAAGVYSTAAYAYNARNQLTSIRHYQGTEASGVYQQRTLEYDGYGRLVRRTTPEQGVTDFAYNPDDTLAWTRDARGAKANFAYSPRHLVTGVNFDVPAGVAATHNLTFAYDAAGNRTLMTDGLGSVAYTYDSLSRLTQESRSLHGVGVFNLTYGYDHAGLASVTNHWGSQVAYAKDHTGTVTAVNGAGPVSAPTYAQGLQYRAFGALKQMTYGNALQLSVSYDTRMRAAEWNVAGVMGSEYRYDYFNEHTGKVTFARNLYDARLHRSYLYDHVGRLSWAYTGAEAEAHAFSGQWGVQNGPYAHAYFHDVWGNITSRMGWGGWNASVSYTYAGNRISSPGHTYDASGNLVDDGGQYAYDATGQQTSAVHALWNVGSGYDGDRLRVKKVENGQTTYYLRSSALGGQVVAELDSSGAWRRGHVYLGGQLLAVQAGGAVRWQHEDPVTKAKKETDASGGVSSATVVDPWGGEAAASFQQNPSQQRRKYTTYERDVHNRDEAMHRQYYGWYSRFTQPDPSDGSYDLTDPQSLNRYAYTNGDPVNYTDPSGLNRAGPNTRYADLLTMSTQYGSVGALDVAGQFGYFGYEFWDSPVVNDHYLTYTVDGVTRSIYLGSEQVDMRGTVMDFGDPGGQVGGAGVKGSLTFDPCAGRKSGGLYYSDERRDHIDRRHMRADTYPGRSKYNQAFVSVDAVKWDYVELHNNQTFQNAVGFRSGRNIVYVYAYPVARDVPVLGTVSVGVGRDSGRGNMVTNVNTLVVRDDCRSVVTSYPGLPTGVGPNDPRVTGTPIWSPNYVVPHP